MTARLAKTGRLYLETIPRLTSGADWAQYGQVLESTCATLAAGGTGGFTTTDCDAVDQAVAATELETPIASAAAQVASTCPAGTTRILRKQDDDRRSRRSASRQRAVAAHADATSRRTGAAAAPARGSRWDPIPSSDGTTRRHAQLGRLRGADGTVDLPALPPGLRPRLGRGRPLRGRCAGPGLRQERLDVDDRHPALGQRPEPVLPPHLAQGVRRRQHGLRLEPPRPLLAGRADRRARLQARR